MSNKKSKKKVEKSHYLLISTKQEGETLSLLTLYNTAANLYNTDKDDCRQATLDEWEIE